MAGPPIVTDDRGRYRLAVPMPGSYLITARVDGSTARSDTRPAQLYTTTYYPGTLDTSATQRIEITGNHDVQGIDIRLVPSVAAVVSGIVLDAAGLPYAGTVSLSTSARSGAVETVRRTTATDRTGAFQIRDVPRGDYVVKAAYMTDLRRQFGMHYVTVVDPDPSAMSIAMGGTATVTGRVVLDGILAADDMGITVSAYSTDPDLAPAASSGVWLPSSRVERGTFRLVGVTGPGRLLVTASRCESCYVESALVNGIDAASQSFDFGLDGRLHSDVEIVLSRDGGVLEGAIRRDDGRSGGASVVVFSTDRSAWHPRSRLVKTTTVATGTTFGLTALPPGEYFVAAVGISATAGDSTALDNPTVLEELSSRAQRVRIAAGERRRITLTLIPR